ncbi:MAG TPA: A24 family peptidase [Candidatus Sulfotelmatobacter sp.]|nr:A24 family peptidase [Candidatus Sulfotelmatobacter sp.]
MAPGTPQPALSLMVTVNIWALALFAVVAGVSDLRFRRIPNWLNVSGLVLGIALNSATRGLSGAGSSLLGAGVGLILLLPLAAVGGMGMGDLKFIASLGAFLGLRNLMTVLVLGVFVNFLMAVAAVIWKRRVLETARNLSRILTSLAALHLPGPELTLENPRLLKVPFGVAMAVAVIIYTAGYAWGGVRIDVLP